MLETGNVIIRTSHKPSGIFVVHSEVLSKGSDYLRAQLCGQWHHAANAEGSTSPVHPDGTRILDLYFDHDMKMCLLTTDVSLITI